MSSLLCIAGPPGAGKSTVSTLVSARLERSVLVRGDAFYRFLDRGKVAPWLPEATEQNRVVIRASGAAAGQFARGGYEVVFDGVLGPWWLPSFFEGTGADSLHYVILLPSADRCVSNVLDREGQVDEPATRGMHAAFENALVDFDSRHVIADPQGNPDDVAREVLSRSHKGHFAYDTGST